LVTATFPVTTPPTIWPKISTTLAVSNTSPISNLAGIGRLDLLKSQFSELWIPDAVAQELKTHPNPGALALIEEAIHDEWIRITAPQVHQGEAEAIALAADRKASMVIIDEQESRALASKLAFRSPAPWVICYVQNATDLFAPLILRFRHCEQKPVSSFHQRLKLKSSLQRRVKFAAHSGTVANRELTPSLYGRRGVSREYPSRQKEHNSGAYKHSIINGSAEPFDHVMNPENVMIHDAFHQVENPPPAYQRSRKSLAGPHHRAVRARLP
jgi:hypothetical protein